MPGPSNDLFFLIFLVVDLLFGKRMTFWTKRPKKAKRPKMVQFIPNVSDHVWTIPEFSYDELWYMNSLAAQFGVLGPKDFEAWWSMCTGALFFYHSSCDLKLNLCYQHSSGSNKWDDKRCGYIIWQYLIWVRNHFSLFSLGILGFIPIIPNGDSADILCF